MSQFRARKVKTYFAATIDVKHKGSVSKKDAEDMADSLTDAEKGSSELRALAKSSFVALWRMMMKSSGAGDDGKVTADVLVATIDQQKNNEEFKENFIKIYNGFFRIADANGDGFLSEAEYARLFAGIGVKDTSFVKTALKNMDRNKDGKVSLSEYAPAVWKYLATEDEHLLWGPLVN